MAKTGNKTKYDHSPLLMGSYIMEDNRFKIMIVEDSKLNQELLRRILEKDYRLIFVQTGLEALENVKTEHPDLILLDIVLPGIDGFEVLRQLKKCDTSRSIPVIIISGRSKPDEEVKGLKTGAVDYITKPFNEVVVKARVETHERILKQMRIIEEYGLIDTLTNIPNRRQFDQHVAREWNRAIRDKKSISLLMIDVDHFKIYNDTYGHQQGDVALQKAASTIASSLKRKIDIAARWGGEEFAVLLPNTGLEGAKLVAEVIRQNIESTLIPGSFDDSHHNITVSIGAAHVQPDNNSSISDLILQADRALYKAKDLGRNRVSAADPE